MLDSFPRFAWERTSGRFASQSSCVKRAISTWCVSPYLTCQAMFIGLRCLDNTDALAASRQVTNSSTALLQSVGPMDTEPTQNVIPARPIGCRRCDLPVGLHSVCCKPNGFSRDARRRNYLPIRVVVPVYFHCVVSHHSDPRSCIHTATGHFSPVRGRTHSDYGLADLHRIYNGRRQSPCSSKSRWHHS
jgi:hypothetical protein